MTHFFEKFNKNPKYWLLQFTITFALLNYLFGDWNCRKDLSSTNRFELTESTEKIVNQLPQKLFIDAYYSNDVPGEYRSRLAITKELIKEIASINKEKVELRFYDPDGDENLQKRAQELGIEPQTVQKLERNAAEVKQAYFGLTLTIGNKSETIPVAFFAEQVEYQILSTLKKMLRSNEGSGIAVISIEGANSSQRPGPGSGKDTFGVFIHQALSPEMGYIPDININEEKVPEEIITLLWVGSGNLTDVGKLNLDQFLMQGGNLVYFSKTMDFSLNPERNNRFGGMMGGGMGAGLAQGSSSARELEGFFEHYGFKVNSNMILEPNNALAMGPLVQVKPGVIGRYHYPFWVVSSKDSGNFDQNSDYTKEIQNILIPWTSTIDYFQSKQPKAKFTEIIKSTPNAEAKSDFILLGEDNVANIQIKPNGTPFTLALTIEGSLQSYFSGKDLPDKKLKDKFLEQTVPEKKSKIIVFGSPYIISDILALPEFREIFQEANIPFIFNLMDILNGDKDLIAARSRKSSIKTMKPFSNTIQIFFSFLNVILLPFCIGFYAFLRMKKRISRVKNG